ncbi:LacI family DNA-binding transcriptional regulator [Actinosynnema pretiosum subsp. pretiosum]|uniref:Transcriptional regulator, LacI family n=2 Tax=Actinosynnema TaxID=40566 RepID=C6WAP5_ACTMD|nr:LacI family DNA-binding transcriptional regulator [Actinosynnema mirum]ACU37364.1 transcriptional regulator, LacI family [Actinosynnema mirum DSM 43827]AXX30835.1 putative LacI-family transcriptional regulator [Actinosynnema pretiosum subsp. pretiosum]QUF05053.1 LacI family DNA-binding transcriptional regulator [Actinosynnema pretiosum subsp. pretiosum]
MSRVTIAQVAAEAGTSAMTVSNVLNNRPGASGATRERVLAAARRLGYRPNLAARHLRGGRTGLVGVLTHDLTSQYALEIVRGIADELAVAQREVLISATYQDAHRETERIGLLTGGLVDALLLVAPVLDADALALLADTAPRCPTVVVDPRAFDIAPPTVAVDNYGGSRAATEHLIGLGHTRIAHVCGHPGFESSAERLRGYRDAVRLAGLPTDEVPDGAFSHEWGFHAGAELAERADPPTAVVAASDLIALGVIDAARARGLSVPADLSVVGFDDLPLAAQLFPGLTTVRQPLHDMGVTAVRMLTDRPDSPRDVRMDTTLITRGTTRGVL